MRYQECCKSRHIYLEFFSTFITRSRALLNLYRICRFYTPQILCAIFAGRSIIKFCFVIAYIPNRFLFIFLLRVLFFWYHRNVSQTYNYAKFTIAGNTNNEWLISKSFRRIFIQHRIGLCSIPSIIRNCIAPSLIPFLYSSRFSISFY